MWVGAKTTPVAWRGVSHCKWFANGSQRYLAATRGKERIRPVGVAAGCHVLPAVAARCREGSGSSSPPSDTSKTPGQSVFALGVSDVGLSRREQR